MTAQPSPAQPNPSDTCPVCLRKLKRCDVLAQPESCGHQFCYICISEWAKNVNTCPVDRIKFNFISVRYKDGSKSEVYFPDADLAMKNEEDVTFCEVCNECTREDSLLLCDGCDKGYHLDCLVPPLSEIPEGNWYCTICQPIVTGQMEMASPSQDECSVNAASDAEGFNDSSAFGTKRKPIFIDDDDNSDDVDDDGDECDGDNNSLSGSSSGTLETMCLSRRTARRIEDDDSFNDDLMTGSKEPILSSPTRPFASPEYHSEYGNRADNGDEVSDSDSSNHSGVHAQSITRSRSSWRLVLSTSSSNASTPRKDVPESSVSDPLFSAAENGFVVDSSAPAPSTSTRSPLSDVLFATCNTPEASSQPSVLLSNGGQINSGRGSEPLVDPFLSPSNDRSNTLQLKQKSRRPELVQSNHGVVQKGVPDALSGPLVCDDPLTNTSVRLNRPVQSSAKQQQGVGLRKKKVKRRRRVTKGTRKKESKGLKKRRQSLQFVSNGAKSDEDDPSYVPVVKTGNFTLTPKEAIRTRARTAATHSPCGRNPRFTAAVMEAQRCPDSSDGLIKARAVLKGEKGGMSQAGPLSCGTGLSPLGGCLSNSRSMCSARSEISRRMVPKRRLIQILGNVPMSSSCPSDLRSASLQSSHSQESDLVGSICQKLDDLQSKHNIIKRDGTVIPIRQLDSSKPTPGQENESSRVTLFSEPEFSSPDPSPLAEIKIPLLEVPEIRDDVLICSSSTPHTSAVKCSLDVLARSASSSTSKSSHGATYSGMKKSISSNLTFSSNEIDPIMRVSSSSNAAVAMDCLANGPLKASSSKTELFIKPPAPSQELVKKFVYPHYIKRTITEHEYHRIIERATKKVEAGSRFDVMRIKKLVEDYVLSYIRQRDTLTS